ncbi:MAG: hypothetical protein KF870_15680 [Leadbetterella sp.]|nr:hypothetical protein [Leadbetterella sp.]
MEALKSELTQIKRASIEVLFIPVPDQETALKTRKILLEIIQTAIDKILTGTVSPSGSLMARYVLDELLALKKTVINLS